MTKTEFLDKLKKGLSGIPKTDVIRSLDFYGEMIDDRMEEGMSESDAVADVGSVDEAISQILSEIPLTKLVKEKIRPKRSLNAFEIILLVLGSPIWLSLLISVIAVILTIYIVFWSVIVSLWAIEVSVSAVALISIFGLPIYFLQGNLPAGIFVVGCGLLLAGLAIFIFYGCAWGTKGLMWFSKKIFIFIKRKFVRKVA